MLVLSILLFSSFLSVQTYLKEVQVSFHVNPKQYVVFLSSQKRLLFTFHTPARTVVWFRFHFLEQTPSQCKECQVQSGWQVELSVSRRILIDHSVPERIKAIVDDGGRKRYYISRPSWARSYRCGNPITQRVSNLKLCAEHSFESINVVKLQPAARVWLVASLVGR